MKKRQFMFYLAPAVILCFIFFIIPLIYLVYVSFYEWNGLGPKIWNGIDNYAYVLRDRTFHTAFQNTLIWIASAVCLHVPFGLLLALLLNRKPKGVKLFRILYFIPNVISTTAIAFLWYFIFHVEVGLLNSVLTKIGLTGLVRAWLNRPETALFSNQVPFILYAGLTMVIFLTQLTTIPGELYEAAQMDGATGITRDIYICIPLLKPAVVTNLLLNVAFCLRTFEYPFLMTGGGPANSTMNLSLYIYKTMISANRYGISMVAGLTAVALGFIVMAVIRRLDRRQE